MNQWLFNERKGRRLSTEEPNSSWNTFYVLCFNNFITKKPMGKTNNNKKEKFSSQEKIRKNKKIKRGAKNQIFVVWNSFKIKKFSFFPQTSSD